MGTENSGGLLPKTGEYPERVYSRSVPGDGPQAVTRIVLGPRFFEIAFAEVDETTHPACDAGVLWVLGVVQDQVDIQARRYRTAFIYLGRSRHPVGGKASNTSSRVMRR